MEGACFDYLPLKSSIAMIRLNRPNIRCIQCHNRGNIANVEYAAQMQQRVRYVGGIRFSAEQQKNRR